MLLDYNTVDWRANLEASQSVSTAAHDGGVAEAQSQEFLLHVAVGDLGLRERLAAREIVLLGRDLALPTAASPARSGARQVQARLVARCSLFKSASAWLSNTASRSPFLTSSPRFFADLHHEAGEPRHHVRNAILVELDLARELQGGTDACRTGSPYRDAGLLRSCIVHAHTPLCLLVSPTVGVAVTLRGDLDSEGVRLDDGLIAAQEVLLVRKPMVSGCAPSRSSWICSFTRPD